MTEKTKTGADKKLINKLFDLDPIDWARYPNGKLSFIAPNGSKATYTQEQLNTIRESHIPAPKKKQAKKTNPDKKTSKLSAGAESGDPCAIAASSREAKRTSAQADAAASAS